MTVERDLGGGGDTVIDYTVFAMCTVTLTLLLVIEFLRSKVDLLADGRQFFLAVLNSVYRELTTLGIVESIIFLIHHYYKGMNIAVEKVFAMVHFALFFVAIFNAIMSVILYRLTSRVASVEWVQTEDINIEHYVSIRRQFESVEDQLRQIAKTLNPSSFSSKQESENVSPPPKRTIEKNYTSRWKVIDGILEKTEITMKQKNKLLMNRYQKLLVQLRFHELRIDFIDANDLPTNFSVSEYLLKAMNDIFLDLVHISSREWLYTLGVSCLIYFSMGIVTDIAPSNVGVVISTVYFGFCVLFLIFTIIIHWKIKRIFHSIMSFKKKSTAEIWNDNIWAGHNENGTYEHQVDLFWGTNPHIISHAVQMMQLGYAFLFAILLVFNESINVSGSWTWYILAPVISYVCFALLWSYIIPKYTQCTSLGELVRNKNLVEAEATFRLQEERQDYLDRADQIESEIAIADRIRSSPSQNAKNKQKNLSTALAEFVRKPTRELSAGLQEISNRNDGVVELNESFSDDFSEGIPDIVEVEDDVKKELFSSRARRYFLSPTYRQLSALFTVFGFFLVSLRVELILLDTCLMEDNQCTWDFFNRTSAFWVELTFFLFFIIESLVMVKLISGEGGERKVFFAGFFDIGLSGICVIVLIIAEARRCCSSNCDQSIRYAIDGSNAAFCETIECCPVFGSRLCGGVGGIEPFTSIIAFRLFRFMIGDYLSQMFKRENSKEITFGDTDSSSEQKDSGRKDMSHNPVHKKGTIIEMWTAAIEKYPDIAEEHGMFSEHILKAMLGIDISNSSIILNQEDCGRYLGKDYENSNEKHKHFQSPTRTFRSISSGSKRSHGAASHFSDFDDNGMIHSSIIFSRPNAPLIRSMRRCLCKEPPFIEDWTLVDVILTSHEIVWLDAKEVDDVGTEKVIAMKHAIESTKGGKGMQLRDVVEGREVLGRVILNDVHDITIQRTLPGMNQYAISEPNNKDIDEEKDNFPEVNAEYWSKDRDDEQNKTSQTRLPSSILSMENRWGRVTEDRLKITSNKSKLYLRFIVDLLQRETWVASNTSQTQKQVDNGLGEGCLLWCLTMSHTIGKSKLKNSKHKLSHYGQDPQEEIIDFIEVQDESIVKLPSMNSVLGKILRPTTASSATS